MKFTDYLGMTAVALFVVLFLTAIFAYPLLLLG